MTKLVRYTVTAFVLGIFSLVMVYQGCSDVRLVPQTEVIAQASKGQMCLAPPEDRVTINKVLFVVDKSGSNTQNDPDDVRRADNIQAFLDEYRDDPYHKYGYIVFGVDQNRAESYITGPSGGPGFGNADDLQMAIDRHRAEPDDGCTPYLTALDLAKQAIVADMQDYPQEDSIYNVFFLSDGFPNDANSAVACSSTTPVTNSPSDPYLNKVRDLVSLATDKIFLSTAYYTPEANDPGRAAAAGLSYMAQVGGGHFVDLQADGKLDFDELKLGPRPEAWTMKRMVAYNMNSAFCSDGSIDADSDADGLCDKDEIKFNQIHAQKLATLGKQFDPLNRNSLNAQYGDLFSYKFDVLPTGDGLNECNLSLVDEDFDLLNECEERALADSQANGPTPQWTQQMRSRGGSAADPRNPDSDGDGFLDVIEFFQFGIKSTAVDYTSIFDRYVGGVTAETLMTEHRHPQRPDVFADSSYDIEVRFEGINAEGQNCYSFRLDQLALYNTSAVSREQVSDIADLAHGPKENVVLLYYIATQERNPNGPGYLFYSYQVLRQGAMRGLSLHMFEDYKVPEVPILVQRDLSSE